MNIIHLLGRTVGDPQVKYTENGKCVTQFILAVNRGYSKDQVKEGTQTTDFIPCVAFDAIAERIGNNVSKGQRLLINRGALRINSYKDKQGNNRYHTEVHVHDYEYIEAKLPFGGTVVDLAEEVF